MSIKTILEKQMPLAGVERLGNRSHTRVFHVEMTSATDNTATILYNRGIIPKPNDQYPGDELARCTEVSYNRIDATHWDVVCQYEYQGLANTDGRNKAPWDMLPYDISISSIPVQVAAVKAYQDGDLQGAPSLPIVIPGTNKPFNPPVVMSKWISVLKFSYNLRQFGLGWDRDYKDTTNLNAVTICDYPIPAGCGLLQTLDATYNKVVDSQNRDTSYWKINASILVSSSPKGFEKELLLAGYHFVEGGKVKPIKTYQGVLGAYDGGGVTAKNANAEPISEAALLNLDGTLVADQTDITKAVYKTFKLNFTKDWSPLNLPKDVR